MKTNGEFPMKKFALLAMAIVFGLAASARAGLPVQLGVAGDSLQVFSAEREITGLRLNLPYSENDEMTGLDFGIAGGGGTIRGIRLNLFNFSSVHSAGLEAGLSNYGETFSGVQFGIFNIVEGEVQGWQTALFNNAGELHGFQLGIVNRAGSLHHGVQLGLINIVKSSDAYVLPIVSWGF
jgi:hypothetical protein